MGKLWITSLHIAFIVSAGCCLDSIKLKPQLDTVDLKTAKAGSASFDVDFKLQECCPEDKQKELALGLQEKIRNQFNKLLLSEITLETYNSQVKAAKDAIENVILVCKASKATKNAPGLEQVFSLDQAWAEVKKVSDQL
ncbi:MAG: hypothetical protein JSS26_16600 [Nitrospira sp.]|nr:hypothetical protein [Nitrospira sp.]